MGSGNGSEVRETCYATCGMTLIVKGAWRVHMGVSITRLRSYQLSLVDRQGLRINLISSGQTVRFPVQGDAQLSPSSCCFLLCFSSHQADCSPPRVVKGFGIGVKSRLSLGFIAQIDCSTSGL